jgi:hypothetical protein
MNKIRFLTSNYKDLFQIEDGQEVTIKFGDGTSSRKICTYIDETHFSYGGTCYHICEFAETMGRYKAEVSRT